MTEIETAFREIFERKWYTNHGPLVQELEAELEVRLRVEHAICMTNRAIAEMIAVKAGGGKVHCLEEGACVCTDDDDLADRLRNIRSSYGAVRRVDVPLTGNGRMSEAQAALNLCRFNSIGRVPAL